MPVTRRSLLLGTAGLLATGARAVSAASPTLHVARTGRSLAAIAEVAVREGQAPGIVLALWSNGRRVAQHVRGRANLETATPMAASSVFRIGSLTKQFTAAMIARLAADGRLALDDPASRHLPELSGQAPFTLAELMHHTAGVRDGGYALAPEAPERSQRALARAVAAQRDFFEFAPGTAWHYSNANYVLLGAVIEAATGQPLAAAARTLLLEPFGLAHCAFDDSADVVPGRASGYAPGGEGGPPWRHAAALDVFQAGGAGAMRGTAEEICRWHQALFDPGRAPAWRDTLLAPARLRDGRLASANRHAREDAVLGTLDYGGGLQLETLPRDGSLLVHHTGFIDGYSSYLATHVASRLTVACLCNVDVHPGLPFRAVRRAVFQSLLG